MKPLQTISLAALIALLIGLAQLPAAAAPSAQGGPAPAATYRLHLPMLSAGGASAAGPSSAALIDAAEASGAISAEAATLYRVYASFADPRLPAALRGDDSQVEDHGQALDRAAARWGQLSAPTRALLQPFFTPPAYAGSWAAGVTAGAGLAAGDEPAPLCGGLTARWQWIDSTNGRARIWWQDSNPGDQRLARMLAEQFDNKIWPALRALMGRDNLSDKDEGCNGLDGRLDVYLVDMKGANPAKGWNVTYPPTCGTEPTFIQLNRRLPDLELRSALAHELMHAFQWAFPMSTVCDREADRWWREATATWAMHYVYPRDNLEWKYAELLLKEPAVPLDRVNGLDDNHMYGAYLLPFYMQHKHGPQLIRQSWEAAANQNLLRAINSVLPGGFERAWPEFALHNWNGGPAPYDSYRGAAWDGLTQQATTVADRALKIGSGPNLVYTLPVEVPHLASEYYRFTFPEEAARGITFYNGFTFKGEREALEGGTGLGMRPLSDAERRGGRVQALIKIGGQWRKEDWTDRPIVFFCRDQVAERVEELVLVFSNSDHEDDERVLRPLGEEPVLAASNAGCWKWQGTASIREESKDIFTKSFHTETMFANITWVRREPYVEDVNGLYYQLIGYGFEPTGTLDWAYDAEKYDADPPDFMLCRAHGKGRVTLTDQGMLSLYSGGVLDGPGEREYEVDGRHPTRGQVLEECYMSEPMTLTRELIYLAPDIAHPKISADGQTITATTTEDCSDEFARCTRTETWTFKAVRE